MERELAERIGKALKQKRLSPYRVSREHPEITDVTINRIVSGETADPRISTLRIIADAVGMTVSELIGEEEPPRALGRHPCDSWADLQLCLLDLGFDRELAEKGIEILQVLVTGTTAEKRSGRKSAG